MVLMVYINSAKLMKSCSYWSSVQRQEHERWILLKQLSKEMRRAFVELRKVFSVRLCRTEQYMLAVTRRRQIFHQLRYFWFPTDIVPCRLSAQSYTHDLEHRAEQQPLKPFNMMTFHLPVYHTPQLGLRVARSILISTLFFETTGKYPN
jgi:hypothetical protein